MTERRPWGWPSSSRGASLSRKAIQQEPARPGPVDAEVRLAELLLLTEHHRATQERQLETLAGLLERLQQCVSALEAVLAAQERPPEPEEAPDPPGLLRSYPIPIGVGLTLGLVAMLLAFYLFSRG